MTAARRLALVFLCTIGLGLTAPDGYWEQMSTMLAPQEDYNVTETSGRLQIWKRGLGYMWARPIMGVGAGNFARAEWTLSPLAQNQFAGVGLQLLAPHSSFIEVGVELGVPALLIVLSILGGGTVGLMRVRRRMPKRWLTESADRKFLYLACVYLPVSFIGWAVTAAFVSHAYLMTFYLLAGLYGAVLVLTQRELRRERVSPPGR
jgi:O-antigen ligase